MTRHTPGCLDVTDADWLRMEDLSIGLWMECGAVDALFFSLSISPPSLSPPHSTKKHLYESELISVMRGCSTRAIKWLSWVFPQSFNALWEPKERLIRIYGSAVAVNAVFEMGLNCCHRLLIIDPTGSPQLLYKYWLIADGKYPLHRKYVNSFSFYGKFPLVTDSDIDVMFFSTRREDL